MLLAPRPLLPLALLVALLVAPAAAAQAPTPGDPDRRRGHPAGQRHERADRRARARGRARRTLVAERDARRRRWSAATRAGRSATSSATATRSATSTRRRRRPRAASPARRRCAGRLDRSALAVDAGLRAVRQDAPLRRRRRGVARVVGRLGRGAQQQADAAAAGQAAARPLGRVQRRRRRLHRPEHGRRRRDRRRRRPGRAGVHAAVRGTARRARVGEGGERRRATRSSDVDVMPKQEQAVDQLPQDELPPETFADKPFRIDKRAYRARGKVPVADRVRDDARAAARRDRRGRAGAGRAVRPAQAHAARSSRRWT